MIAYIVTETRQNYERGMRHAGNIRLEQLSGEPCMVIYYQEVALARLLAMGTRAVIFGGYSTPLDDHALDSFAGIYEIVREGDLPMLGLCGGHQVIAELWAAHNDDGLTRMRHEADRLGGGVGEEPPVGAPVACAPLRA